MGYADPEVRRAYMRRRYWENIDAERARGREKARRLSAKAREAQRLWRLANPEKYKAQIARRDPASRKESQRRWTERHPEKVRAKHLRRAYQMSMEEYEAALTAQNGRCAACGDLSDRRLHVDHDHRTQQRRGLLCWRCNNGLGLFADDPARLRAAADYLEKYR